MFTTRTLPLTLSNNGDTAVSSTFHNVLNLNAHRETIEYGECTKTAGNCTETGIRRAVEKDITGQLNYICL